jgi:NAD-dependent deacetylase
LKPEITFFGEALPRTAWLSSTEAMRQAELVLVLGTSLAVFPAAGLPAYRNENARLVIINREATPLDAEAHAVLRGDLPDVMQRINDHAFQA